ncbi:cytochrome P450 [Aspergillus sclerotiicarbonarius CBS 121057]|uniref:Cytochrome P450 n=1 Tax=Aspergillus sclerotiicarbonarius (strain CBS 121057 / IBT 28362) TaxID=1448318 RepID=A0A319EJ26_ASPSB|nr:cytochrome P450 [Aspergillus sclerotiicarbonarius CBS 121057]
MASFDITSFLGPLHEFSSPLAITLCLLGLFTFYRWLLPNPLPGIPYNRTAAASIWGDAPSLRADPAGLAKWCSKQLEAHGSPIYQALMGPLSKPVVLVADVGQTREMLMGRSDFDRSSYIIDRFPLFGEFHLNMKTGDAWRTSRSWLKDLLAPHYLHQTAGPAIHSSVLNLIQLWESKARVANGRPFSMLADLKTLALDVIVRFHFGDDFEDSALRRQIQFMEELNSPQLEVGTHSDVVFPRAPLHPFQQGLTDVGDRMAAIYTTKWPPALVSWWARYMSPHYRKFFVGKNHFIRKHIDLALQRCGNEEEAKTGIDYMVYREQKAARKADRQPVFGKQIMIDEAYGNLIAGQHTTSAALIWILKLLAEHPAVQTRLCDELQTVQEGRLPTAAGIIHARLPYLDAVLEETLRLRAAMLVPRDAARDTELLGRRIPKGTVVLLVCQGPDYSLSPSSQYWSDLKTTRKYPGHGTSDLEAFHPERWLVQNEHGQLVFDGSTYPQLAFGLGIRACWGRRLAQLEMRIMTAMMVWKFDFLDVPAALAGHEATYDISYRAKKGFLRLRIR